MSRGSNVRKEEYEYIKALLQKGEKITDIANKMGRGDGTIRTINYSHNYDDFVKTPSKELRSRGNKGKQVQISVSDICPQEDVASQCDERPVMGVVPMLETHCDVTASDLTAKDKKELAMYAIDQHYFFLKQLTGVI